MHESLVLNHIVQQKRPSKNCLAKFRLVACQRHPNLKGKYMYRQVSFNICLQPRLATQMSSAFISVTFHMYIDQEPVVRNCNPLDNDFFSSLVKQTFDQSDPDLLFLSGTFFLSIARSISLIL